MDARSQAISLLRRKPVMYALVLAGIVALLWGMAPKDTSYQPAKPWGEVPAYDRIYSATCVELVGLEDAYLRELVRAETEKNYETAARAENYYDHAVYQQIEKGC